MVQDVLIRLLVAGGLVALALMAAVVLRHSLAGFHALVCRTPVGRRIILGLFLAVCIAYGGSKNTSTNNVALPPSAPTNLTTTLHLHLLSTPNSHPSVTPEDIARGWQLWEVRTNAAVSYAIYNSPAGGIYQVQALVGVGWGADDERYYVWEDYSDYIYGIKTPRDLKSFGVCDAEWQKNVRNSAKSRVGDDDYAYAHRIGDYGNFGAVKSRAWKCNIFVAHRLVDSGFAIPAVHKRKWPPLANEWGDAAYAIPGWTVLGAEEFLQPGMIAICPSAGRHGHIGILDFDGMALSAQEFHVTRKSNPMRWDCKVFRTYREEE